MVCPKGIVDLCFSGMDGEGSSSLSRELFTCRETVEQVSNAVGNDVRLLKNAVHGLLGVGCEEDWAGTMKRTAVNPIYF